MSVRRMVGSSGGRKQSEIWCEHRAWARLRSVLSSWQAGYLRGSLTPAVLVHRVGCFPCSGLPTCPDVCLAEQPGQAPHAVEGVEVMHVLVQPVHPILVLQTGTHKVVGRCLPTGPQSKPSCAGVCVHGQQVPGRRQRVGMGGFPGPVMMLSAWPSHTSSPQPVRAGAPTCGKPVRMLARLGEQLLTEVKAFWKITLRRASASRLGVWMAELL